jgi:hypothetical protein
MSDVDDVFERIIALKPDEKRRLANRLFGRTDRGDIAIAHVVVTCSVDEPDLMPNAVATSALERA